MKIDNLIKMIDENIAAKAETDSKPTILLGPKFIGKTTVYEIIKRNLRELSDKEIVEIVVEFEDGNPHTLLKEKFDTPLMYGTLEDYFLNSGLIFIKKELDSYIVKKEYLILFDKLERLKDKDLQWVLRNCLSLIEQPTMLSNLNITFVVKGTLDPKQVTSGISPFALELSYPRSLTKKVYLRELKDLGYPSGSFIDEIFRMTDGDLYFTKQLINTIDMEQKGPYDIDSLLNAFKVYSQKGACNDPLKYWMLKNLKDVIEYEDNNFLSIEELINFVNNDWNKASSGFVKKSYMGGFVKIFEGKVIFRSPELIRKIYNESSKREKILSNVVLSEIIPDILSNKEQERFNTVFKRLKEAAYFGFIEEFVVGGAKRENEKFIYMEGTYNYSNHIEMEWANKNHLKIGQEALFLLFDIREYENESKRETHFFPIEKVIN